MSNPSYLFLPVSAHIPDYIFAVRSLVNHTKHHPRKTQPCKRVSILGIMCICIRPRKKCRFYSRVLLEFFARACGRKLTDVCFSTSPVSPRPVLLQPDDELEIECLGCVKAFMNSEFGLDTMLEQPDVVRRVALWFTSRNDKVCFVHTLMH